jgi:hypothetical protein
MRSLPVESFGIGEGFRSHLNGVNGLHAACQIHFNSWISHGIGSFGRSVDLSSFWSHNLLPWVKPYMEN